MSTDWKQICQEMLTFLQWYIDEDETSLGDPGNTYLIQGRNHAIQFTDHVKHLLAQDDLIPDESEPTADHYALEYTRAISESGLIKPLPQELDTNQWQSLLISALHMLLNTNNPAPDLAYARWLLDQWDLTKIKQNHEDNKTQKLSSL
jgi:hypothetical protein